MNYEDSIQWIHSREKFKFKPGLKRMEWMMEKLGHPEKQLNSIHIAGTNGKGSTVSFLRNLLQKQEYTVGTFTSPYIVRFNERMSINGDPISDYELADIVEMVKPLAEEAGQTELGEPTEFEVITVIAILYFKNKGVDFAVFETGLGGRYDSTNVIHPLVAIITNIGKDHTHILGNTFEEISYQKAGIIKKKTPVLTCVKQKEALEVIKKEAALQQADLLIDGEDFSAEYYGSSSDGEVFTFHMKTYDSPELVSNLKGVHQVANASLALGAIEQLRKMGFLIQQDFYPEAISATTWPARFETVQEDPRVILDGAHNEEGTEALVSTIENYFPNQTIYLLYAAVEGKPVHNMLEKLQPIVKEAWFTQFDFPKSLKGRDLEAESMIEPAHVEEDYREALNQILGKMTGKDVLIVSGSLYFISDIRKCFE
ncbi:bifunctional folylpolyglutamate synthase/dihydrofolate synthase [Halobacillus campisalis]|uniref:tetrahydrofolate synthase n=1 Tax=Halobacillus campisalis TaxID=435909 RepID=A0ABW2K2U1_9BACI|nr:folylpolyglutamate synthase/dihydrofolate synthase family protein [Halobacillus campisalis]